MRAKPPIEIETRLSEVRQRCGLSAAFLARSVGVSRQTIYSIESGGFIPNTSVALRLASVLNVNIPELFRLREAANSGGAVSRTATLLSEAEPHFAGQRLQLCLVENRLIATVPPPSDCFLPAAHGVLTAPPRKPRETSAANVVLHQDESAFRNRILVAGCDPAMSILARHAMHAGVELVLLHRNSSQALQLLKEGKVHIAGTHLRDESTGESNLPAIDRNFRSNAVAVVSFATWEEGIVTARGNPKRIRGIADLGRKNIRLVNREPGAGSRLLLDSHLIGVGLAARQVRGYDKIALGHLPAAAQVRSGEADCCVATSAAARTYGLGFVPLVAERYDLVLRRRHLDHPSVDKLLDLLYRAAFRRELAGVAGYDTSNLGARVR